jgi:TM2 domain-containing membrane protein YozV
LISSQKESLDRNHGAEICTTAFPVWSAKTTVTSIKMKVSYKAALLSTFVFPGVGQFYLKRYWRGLVIMFLSCTGLGYMIWSATISALNRLDDVMVKVQGGTTNLQELSDIVGSKMLTTDPYHDAVFYVIVCLWIFAIIDAYRIGKQREFQDEETSEW